MKNRKYHLRWTTWYRMLTLSCALIVPHAMAQPETNRSPAATNCPALLNYRMPRLQDEVPQNLCQYSGKVLLIVNTASQCRFTDQYQGLEALQARYREQGLVVLGFPANDFSQQEPGSNKEIAEFCQNTFGVKFPMFAKSNVIGPQANPLYKELAQRTGKVPTWNFYKYLINRRGQVIDSYPSLISPENEKLRKAIENALHAQ